MRLLFLFLTILVLGACSPTSETNKERDGTYACTFVDNSALRISSTEGSYMKMSTIEAGDKRVFEYHYQANDEPQIADDEYDEFIRFEIDESLSSFSYTDDELLTISAVFSKVCFCFFASTPEKNVIPQGTISGKKLATGEWEISINTTFYGDELKKIDHLFKKQ